MTPGPLVGETRTVDVDAEDRVPWVLGTQLSSAVGPLGAAPEGSRVLLIEAHGFADRLPYHEQKLTLLFSAMRHFRDELRAAGYEVSYRQTERFAEGLSQHFRAHPEDTLVAMESPSHGAADRLSGLAAEAGGRAEFVENELFLSRTDAFADWSADRDPPYRHEDFYRWMRRETGILLVDGEPAGGEWNYDDRNRDTPPADWEPPARLSFEPDEQTREVRAWVRERFDTWGEGDSFDWPVTRTEALDRLDHFVTERLPGFGTYQDAMREGEWAMAHSLLSPAINIGLLHPAELLDRVEAAFRSGDVPINAAEGFVRQLLGWREFVRHVYRAGMPELADANQLEATAPLPDLYWTGDTDMACLADAVGTVRERGYAHHIQRLMILANFATLSGTDPSELNRWFHATFLDAYHWVTTPNVVEMGSFGAGLFATKPYVASANYVHRMSDYCTDCVYDHRAASGEDACPFNALYWDFLARNESRLRENYRMGLVYSHLDDKRSVGDLSAIRERAAEYSENEGGSGLEGVD